MTTTSSKRIISFIVGIITMVFIINASVWPVEAVSKKDLSNDTSVYYQKGNNYYLMDYQPPIRYGKEFGRASDYTANKTTKVLLKKTWKKTKSGTKILKAVLRIIVKGRITGVGTLVDLAREDVRGVKLVKTTYYNKNTGKHKVGKNKKCRKEVWEIYIRQKNSRTGKFSWVLFHSETGFRSVITVK